MKPTFLLPLCFALPLFAALTLGACAWARQRVFRLVGLYFSGAYALLGAALVAQCSDGSILVYNFGGWPYPAGIVYVADRLSSSMVLLAGLSAFLAHLVGPFRASQEKRPGLWVLLHGMQAGLHGAFLTGDYFNLFVAFEVFLIFSYGLVLFLAGRRRSISLYMFLNIAASTLLLITQGVLYGTQGSLNMAELAGRFMGPQDALIKQCLFALILTVGLLKAGVAPFFQWMPDTYSRLPAGLAAYFSALLTKVGIYVILRTGLTVMPLQAAQASSVLIVWGAVAAWVGVLGALGQKEYKRLLAFHTVSQIGYILCGVGLSFSNKAGAPELAVGAVLLFIWHHSLVKSSLFALSAAFEEAGHSTELGKVRGFMGFAPWVAAAFLLSAFSLAGLPPSSGFMAKFSLLRALAAGNSYFAFFALLLASIMTLASMLKIWKASMSGLPTEPSSEAHPRLQALKIPLLIFAFASWTLPLFWKPVLTWTTETAQQLRNPRLYLEAVHSQRDLRSETEVAP